MQGIKWIGRAAVALLLGMVALGLAWRVAPARVQQEVFARAQPVLPNQLVSALAPPERFEVELCGYGVYVPPSDEASWVPPEVEAGAELALRRAAARLIATGNTGQKALGLYVEAMLPGLSEACIDPLAECLERSAPRYRTLVEFALASSDPATYTLALQACKSGRMKSGACALLTPTGWAEREPDNAMAWLHAMAHTTDRGEARRWLLRAAAAPRLDGRRDALYPLAAEPELVAVGAAVRTASLLHIEGLMAAQIDAIFSLPLHCRQWPGDAELQAACGKLAERLVTQPSTLSEAMTGAGVGKQLGWDESRLIHLNEERGRLSAAMRGRVWGSKIDERFDLGCGMKEHVERRVAARQHMNEIEYARALLAAGAVPPPPSALPSPFGRVP